MHPPQGRVYAPRYRVTALVLCEKIVRVPLMFDAVMRTRMNRETSVETGT
jgi:hypothetical protein